MKTVVIKINVHLSNTVFDSTILNRGRESVCRDFQIRQEYTISTISS